MLGNGRACVAYQVASDDVYRTRTPLDDTRTRWLTRESCTSGEQNKRVLKIIINDTVNLFFKTAINILLI